ncbi:hypothetical protein GCM10010869_28190 [Mesorhizobium tianshanense]|uniref:Uncharacterized protein n=1 Tax=Mesorhizobium tianshanense TaxID=39844 RepID=A0A562MN28_9HYPH|nr:hypothetical protein [Mesorhizobium tianshanense]TWI21218.1 hypothetical protein IQ26_06895 [Mesorhizobium tianshanense]GLS37226.1 hypothetical protein GCM10010869_28190 [Mesorhizobium tianshanense]
MAKKHAPKGGSPNFAVLRKQQDQARSEKDLDRFEEIGRDLAAVIAAEGQKYPHHFLRSREMKARLLLRGVPEERVQGELPVHWFPPHGSFLEYECRWALVEVLRSENPPKDILQLTAALFVPDSGHPLADAFVAVIKGRDRGTRENIYAKAAILNVVDTAVRDGRGTDAGVLEAAERYHLTREYVYRCWGERER